MSARWGRVMAACLALVAWGCGGREPAGSSGEPEGGPIRASHREEVASWDLPPQPPAVADTVLEGTLSKGKSGESPHVVWALRARAGEFLTATLVSSEFDPTLIVADSSGGRLRVLEETDDPKDDARARVELELPEGKSCFLLATGSDPGGRYRLDVELEPPPILTTGGDPTERYALLVGVGDYPGWEHDLPGVSTDLGLVHRMLVETFAVPEENILVLRDKHVSRRRLMEAFLTHLGRAGPAGVAFFYYSGHGIRLETNTYELPPLDPEADGRDEALYLGDGNILLDEEIGALADRLPAERVLLILDSCYSGTGSRAPGVWLKRVPEQSERVRKDLWPDFRTEAPADGGPGAGSSGSAPDPGRHVLLAAAQENERAGVLAGLPDLAPSDTASVFTYHLTRLLREYGGTLTFQALTDSVRARTLATRSFSDVPEQVPEVLTRRGGETVDQFLAKRGSP